MFVQTCSITASMIKQPSRPSTSPTTQNQGRQVHVSVHSISGAMLIYILKPSEPLCISGSLDLSFQIQLHKCSIITSKFTNSWSPCASPIWSNNGIQVRSIWASKCIFKHASWQHSCASLSLPNFSRQVHPWEYLIIASITVLVHFHSSTLCGHADCSTIYR